MPQVRDPKALAAHLGRQKYGKERFQQMSATGRRRAARARAKGQTPEKSMRPGGGGRFAEMVKAISAGGHKKVGAIMRMGPKARKVPA